MANPLKAVSSNIRKVGLDILVGASPLAKGVLGEDLTGMLFDNYVPLERYTEYQRTYNWEIVFPYMMGRVPGMVISKYCKAIVFGDYNFKEIVELQKGPKSFFVPGTLNIDSITTVFLVPVPNLVHGYFEEWKKLLISPEGFYTPQKSYKHPIFVRMYTTQGITSGTAKLVGAFPRTFFRYDLKYEGQDVVRYTVTFSIDDVEFTGMDIWSTIPRVLKHIL